MLSKKEKNNANQENWDKSKDKAMFHNVSCTNSQPQAQVFKKDKCHKSRQRDHLGAGVYVTKVAKINKDKAKNMSHIKCYTCKQKRYIINKCPKKLKN